MRDSVNSDQSEDQESDNSQAGQYNTRQLRALQLFGTVVVLEGGTNCGEFERDIAELIKCPQDGFSFWD